MGVMSGFIETDSDWWKPPLRMHAGLSAAGSWTEARHLMESFLWIGRLHDTPGKEILADTISSPEASG